MEEIDLRDLLQGVEEMDALTLDHILSKWWVETAEELYAKYIAVGKNEVFFMSTAGISQAVFEKILDRTMTSLGEDKISELETRLPVDDFGFGARNPEEEP